jgi:polysaccharide pyruvyl transferase WcaK-like protein
MAPPSHKFSWRRERRLLAFTRDLGRTRAYRLLGARHCILGVTFGPFDATETLFQRLGAPAVDTIGVRDEQSGALASSLGYRNVRAVPDFAFAEPVAARAASLSTGPRDLVLSFRSPVVSGDHDDLSPDIRKLVGELPGASRDRDRLSFVAQATPDKELNQDLWRAFGERTGGDLTCFEGTARSVAPILARYSRARIVLTNRLHVFLLALQQGAVPYLVTRVARHHKISAMVQTLRLEEFLLDLSARSEIHAVTQLDDAGLDRRRQRLVEAADHQREALNRAFDAVVGPVVG